MNMYQIITLESGSLGPICSHRANGFKSSSHDQRTKKNIYTVYNYSKTSHMVENAYCISVSVMFRLGLCKAACDNLVVLALYK